MQDNKKSNNSVENLSELFGEVTKKSIGSKDEPKKKKSKLKSGTDSITSNESTEKVKHINVDKQIRTTPKFAGKTLPVAHSFDLTVRRKPGAPVSHSDSEESLKVKTSEFFLDNSMDQSNQSTDTKSDKKSGKTDNSDRNVKTDKPERDDKPEKQNKSQADGPSKTQSFPIILGTKPKRTSSNPSTKITIPSSPSSENISLDYSYSPPLRTSTPITQARWPRNTPPPADLMSLSEFSMTNSLNKAWLAPVAIAIFAIILYLFLRK